LLGRSHAVILATARWENQGAKYLVDVIHLFQQRKVRLKSITENIDTSTSGGKLIFHVFGALAEFERDLIRESTQTGLQAARARGSVDGRPKTSSLDTPRKIAIAQSLYDDKRNTIAVICMTLNISRATLYRYVHVRKGIE
jgi:DNA invertase Pin-like site-specific DNA recombinase